MKNSRKKAAGFSLGICSLAWGLITLQPAMAEEGHSPMVHEAQQGLAPHSVMIQSSLMSAIDELKGLRTEVKINAERAPSPEFISHFKMFSKEINSDLSMAGAHNKELIGSVKKYPDVASSDDYSHFETSFDDLKALNSDWQSKNTSNSYWKDKVSVMRDLDQIERRLNKALDDSKSFNSSQLKITSMG